VDNGTSGRFVYIGKHDPKLMKQTILFCALALCGCASFSTQQSDTRISPDGTQTTITTTAKSSTFFSAKSNLAKWKARQSEGEQGAEVGGLNQQGATNSVEALKALDSILGKLR
jgi:hypothetical protein